MWEQGPVRRALPSSGQATDPGAGSGHGAKERERAKVSLQEEPCPSRIYLDHLCLIINGFQEEHIAS